MNHIHILNGNNKMEINLTQIISWLVSVFLAWFTAFMKISHAQGKQDETLNNLNKEISRLNETLKVQENLFVRKDIFDTKLEEISKDISDIRAMDISVRLTKIETQLSQIQESIEELKYFNNKRERRQKST